MRERWAALQPQTKGAIVSVVIALVLILWTKAANGDFIGGYTDHLHHAHITWAFLHVGFDVWRKNWEQASQLAPSYPHPCVTWEKYPNPYPAGMHAVFLLPMLLGKYVTPERTTYGKIIIAYLMAIMTAANWHLAAFMRRVGTPVWIALLLAVWIFNVRASLMGFYDGAWLLAGLLSVRALERKNYAHSVLWFAACAFMNYRGISFTPFGLVAFWGLARGGDPPWKKILVTVVSALGAVLVVLTFYWMVKGAPHDKTGAESPLLPLKFRGWALLAMGFGLAAMLYRHVSKMTGITVALSTVLSIVHGVHSWHGIQCLPPLVALSIAERRPLWAQVAMATWLFMMWRFGHFFEPFQWLEEIFIFVQQDGVIAK